jgi:tetratricopeptide (TPR) repeat protein
MLGTTLNRRRMAIDRQLDEASALIGARRLDEATAILAQVCARKKQDGRALHMFGVARAMQGDNDAAEELLRKARTLKPSAADVLTDLGSVLILRNKHSEAADVLEKARRRDPRSQLAMFYHGVALTNLKRLDEALGIFETLVSRDPQNIAYAQNRATILGKLARFDEAEIAVDELLRKQPSMTEALLVKSVVALNRANFDEALALLDRIIASAPDHSEALHNRAHVRLLIGEMEQGWRDYEARWAKIGPKPAVGRVAEWNGEPPAGRSILVHCEQGLGDAMQFCRYARILREQGADVTLVAAPRLHAILRTLSPDIRIVGEAARLQEFDFQIPLMSLPMKMKTTAENIPSWSSYLSADPERVLLWKRTLATAEGFRIGISWQGNPASPAEQGRSVPLRFFEPLSRHSSVRLISLQTMVGTDQLKSLPPGMHVETLGEFDSGPDAFADTAAVMANLDLVITSDTAIAHLAGALGRPTWVPLKRVPDWRWSLDRADSPWYPTMKLYRQQHAGDWAPVFAQMAADLERLLR